MPARLITLITVAQFFAAAPVFSQVPLAALERGGRIRVTAPTISDSERIARFSATSNDTIEFRSESRPVTRSLRLRDVKSLEVSSGVRTRSRQFASIGVIAGGILGYVSSNHNGSGIGTGRNRASENAITGAVAGTVIGGFAGWYLGRNRKSEEWRPVDIAAQLR